MARVTIDDLWLKSDAPTRVRRSLNHAHDPNKARVPAEYRRSRYGRGMRWRCRWHQPTLDGRKRQVSRTFATLADAQEYAAAMEDDIRRGRYHDPQQEQRLFSDVAREWMRSKLDVRQSTLARYELELKLYVLPTWAGEPLSAITVQRAQQWVNALAAGTYASAPDRKKKTRPLAPRTIRSIVKIVFSGVLTYAVRNEWITENPASRVTVPKPARPQMTVLDREQISMIADAASKVGTPSDGLLVLFQAYTGARIDETLALRISDLSEDLSSAVIRRTWSHVEGKRAVLAPPKNGKTRVIAIPRFLAPMLRKQCEGRDPSELVFLSHEGKPVNLMNWRNRVWYPALKAMHLDERGFTIHSLRHSYASMAIAAGADVKTLQQQLGHSSASITLDVYAGFWPNRLQDVARAVDRLADPAGGLAHKLHTNDAHTSSENKFSSKNTGSSKIA